MIARSSATSPGFVALFVWSLTGCSPEGGEPAPSDHYAISEPGAVINYGRSSVASAYLKILGIDLDWPRVVYTEYAEDDLEEPVDFWVADLGDATTDQGKALLTEELVAKYETDSIPSGEKNLSPHCRISIVLPPSLNNDYTIRLSTEDTYSPETQALLDYLFGVYDQYAPAQ